MDKLRNHLAFLSVIVALTGAGCGNPLAFLGGGTINVHGFNSGAQHGTLSTTGAGQALAPVTSDALQEGSPSLSPDGRTLLFEAFGEDGRGVITSVDATSHAQRRLLTDTNQSAFAPAWAANGSFVYSSDALGSRAIVRGVSANAGGGVAVVISGQIAPNADRPSVHGGRIAFDMEVNGTRTVAVANLDGSDLVVLGAGADPNFSPDGSRLVFQREVNEYTQLLIADARTGGDVVQLTNDRSNNSEPTWSPDGQYLAFTSNRTGNEQLYVIRADGASLVQLTRGTANARSPYWTPTNDLYFASDAQGNWDLWKLRLVPST